MSNIQVIDLFAGPGGLGEGFSSFTIRNQKPFKIAISIEKDEFAHRTLTLRSFYRQFTKVPDDYYKYVRGEITRDVLFKNYPAEGKKALSEACLIELGSLKHPHATVVKKIKSNLSSNKPTILIGGPPCQAYSLAGRSKMSKMEGFDSDPRHTLYMEYLKILNDFKPAIFVMENVKGILSSKLNDEYIFDKILDDLSNPSKTLNSKRSSFKKNEQYTIYSLVTDKAPEDLSRNDFIIKSENYGVPQARHRVILLGIRNDINKKPNVLVPFSTKISVSEVIDDLPKIRSGLSKMEDNYNNWQKEISKYNKNFIVHSKLNRGSNYIKVVNHAGPKYNQDWFVDKRLKGVLNHESRGHIVADLHRYYFLSLHAKQTKENLKLKEFPRDLLPNHKNVKEAIKSKSLFSDRFKVQMKNKYATTITSHISRDGHSFIHYDPKQCRSLTVREAARLQTFPDNYFFEGQKTVQYHQVGNAVPPLLAKKIAEIVYDLLKY